MLLFCLGSDTEWVSVGIPATTVQHMIVRNLVERDPAGLPQLTDQGRAVLKALTNPQMNTPGQASPPWRHKGSEPDPDHRWRPSGPLVGPIWEVCCPFET